MTRADDLRRQINKMMGGDVLQMGSDKRYEVEYMPTGILPFDILLNGGIPRGRFVTVTGAYSTLKSYLGLMSIAETQRRGGIVGLIDTEHAYDPAWAEQLGVNTSELIVWPPLPSGDEKPQEVTGEEAFDITEMLIRNKLDLIVFDSVAASLPQQEQDKRLSKESVQPGRLAALLSLAMRKLTAANNKTGMLYINQLREQIGVTFGNPEKATGGRALPYYSSIILNIRAAGYVTENVKLYDGNQYNTVKRKVGQKFVGQVQKSKLSTPWTDLYFNYDMRKGQIDITNFLFAQGVDIGAVVMKGKTWECEGLRAIGKDAFLKKLEVSPEALSNLETAVRESRGLPLLGPSVPARKKAVASKKLSSSSAVPVRTRVQGRVASSSTAVPKKKLSK